MRTYPLLKGLGTTAFMTGFFWLYFHLLHNPAYPVVSMPLTAVDYWIGFAPASLGLYLSLWVYVSLPTAMLQTIPDLLRHGCYVGGVCVTGLLLFYFWPTAVPGHDPQWAGSGIALLQQVDAAGNACPSLHVATAVFSAAWLRVILSEVGAPQWLRAINWLWCAGIVYSALAIRQHVFLDALAGALLGAAFAWLSLRQRCLTGQESPV